MSKLPESSQSWAAAALALPPASTSTALQSVSLNARTEIAAALGEKQTPVNAVGNPAPENLNEIESAMDALQVEIDPNSPDLKKLKIDGIEITFDSTKVRDPPALSFADDIARLAKEWHTSNYLKISGHGIPIKHWDLVYKNKTGIKSKVWESIKGIWGKWKVRCIL